MSDATIRLTEDGPVRYRGGGISCDRGETVGTNADHAEYLADTFDYFEVVDGGDEDTSDDEGTQSLTELSGVGDATAESLRDAGYDTVDAVRSASVEDLVDVDGVGESLAMELSEEGS